MAATHYTALPKAFRRAQGLQTAPWYTVDDLSAAIQTIQSITFKVTAARQEALDTLNGLVDDEPYNMAPTAALGALRFGAGVVDVSPPLFVSAAWGPFPKLFQQLRSALAYKDDMVTRTPSSSGAPPTGRNTYTIDDAQQAWANSCCGIISEIVMGDYTFDQASFERTFRLAFVP